MRGGKAFPSNNIYDLLASSSSDEEHSGSDSSLDSIGPPEVYAQTPAGLVRVRMPETIENDEEENDEFTTVKPRRNPNPIRDPLVRRAIRETGIISALEKNDHPKFIAFFLTLAKYNCDWINVPTELQTAVVQGVVHARVMYGPRTMGQLIWACARLNIDLYDLFPRHADDFIMKTCLTSMSWSIDANPDIRIYEKHLAISAWALMTLLRQHNDNLQRFQLIIDGFKPIIRDIETLHTHALPFPRWNIKATHRLVEVKNLTEEYIQWPSFITDIQSVATKEIISSLETSILTHLKEYIKQFQGKISLSQRYVLTTFGHRPDIVLTYTDQEGLEKRIAIEIDGPGHGYSHERNPRQQRMNQKTHLRDEKYKRAGIPHVVFNYHEWNAIKHNRDKIFQYFDGKLSPYLNSNEIYIQPSLEHKLQGK